jgi:osmoprotectant transport system ATP-binding protein
LEFSARESEQRDKKLMISLHQVSKSFDNGLTYAVKDLSFEVRPKETLVLLGTSGCGKTTTLRMINRLIDPTAGNIEIDGRNIMDQDPVKLRRLIGYAFQGIGLFPHLTVAKNIEITLMLFGIRPKKRSAELSRLLELVELPPGEFADRLPQELSGGQQQRVGVARALAGRPDYLLMDEPFGALDAVTRDNLQQQLIQIQKKTEVAVVFVTHDIFEAITLGDRLAILNRGHLEQIDNCEEIINHPKTDYVRQLFAKPAMQLSKYKSMI